MIMFLTELSEEHLPLKCSGSVQYYNRLPVKNDEWMTSTTMHVAQNGGGELITYEKEKKHITIKFTAYGDIVGSKCVNKNRTLPIYLIFYLPTSFTLLLR